MDMRDFVRPGSFDLAISMFTSFGFFAAMMALQFVLVWMFLPETKGVSLEELQKRLGAGD